MKATQESKWWLNSTTIRYACLTTAPALVFVLKLFGVDISEGEIGAIVDAIVAIMSAIGVIGILIGRFKANKPLRIAK